MITASRFNFQFLSFGEKPPDEAGTLGKACRSGKACGACKASNASQGILYRLSARLSHQQGYSETYTLDIPIASATANPNAAQNVVSACTYGKRTLLSMVFCIACEEDTDGTQASPRYQSAKKSPARPTVKNQPQRQRNKSTVSDGQVKSNAAISQTIEKYKAVHGMDEKYHKIRKAYADNNDELVGKQLQEMEWDLKAQQIAENTFDDDDEYLQ